MVQSRTPSSVIISLYGIRGPVFHPKGPTLRELAVQALSSTERGYDLLAPKFDCTPFRTPDAILRRGAPAPRAAAPVVSRPPPLCRARGRVGRVRAPCPRRGGGPRFYPG